MNRFVKPPRYAVFEREPRMNARANQVIFGPYSSLSEADAAKLRYFGSDDNYYTTELDADHVSPKEPS